MRYISASFCTIVTVLLCFTASAAQLPQAAEQKEWTFLVFLNGHNNLDSFGVTDVNEMEKVGSSDQVNVVVQWASNGNATTKRLLVQKDDDFTKVTTPVVEDLPRVDMGDYKKLVEFIAWGVKNYPAKRYFVNVWNHGSGWHRNKRGELFRAISHDDYTNNSISTEQLGLAMKEAAAIMGQKVDIYGSDACLMQMLEVNTEFASSVGVAVGSQEVEPADGWPYDKFLAHWVASPTMTAAEVSQHLTREYVASYDSTDDVQLSAVDLNYNAQLVSGLAALATAVNALSPTELKSLKTELYDVFNFYYSDYADLQDMVETMQASGPASLKASAASLAGLIQNYVVSNHTAPHFGRAHGISIWLPRSSYTFDSYSSKYDSLAIASTGWKAALKKIVTAN